ncbi:hypothetical protein [Thorsellia anophelis]|uniref:Ig-like domain (Group 2) n=1 Tax=Thorsellia anophelis DSM 18579 TaxID=1123402 RepID=A0A1I0E2Z0_9GAMM|nr:hypothetical protein [Thorsellia anophelis]SET39497.1 hypothetical protein SAMN02583745_02238 [Thorsellia anophelis DSM 18579]
MRIAKLPLLIFAALQMISVSSMHAVEKASGDTGPIYGKKPTANAELEIIKNVAGTEVKIAKDESNLQTEQPTTDSSTESPVSQLDESLKIIDAKLELLPKDTLNDFTNFLPKINTATVKVNDADLDGYDGSDQPVNVNLELILSQAISELILPDQTAPNENSPIQNLTATSSSELDIQDIAPTAQLSELYKSIKWFHEDRTNPEQIIEEPIVLPLTQALKDTYPAETINAYLPNGLPGKVWTGEKGEPNENGISPVISTQGIPFENTTILKSPKYQFKIPPRAPFIFVRNPFPISRVAELYQNPSYINNWWGNNNGITWERPLEPTAENWPLNDSFRIGSDNDVISNVYPFIQVKSIDPNNKVNFPTNGFKGATFRVVTPMMYKNYTWTSSHPNLASVDPNSGVVTLLAPPANDKVEIKITAVPKVPLIDIDGISHAPNTTNNPTIEHRFSLKRWFIHSSETSGGQRTTSFNDAYNSCVNYDYKKEQPYVPPLVTSMTGISPETDVGNWIDGYLPPRNLTTDQENLISLWEEWGNPGTIPINQTWVTDAEDSILYDFNQSALGPGKRIDLAKYHAYPDGPNFYYFPFFNSTQGTGVVLYPDYLDGFADYDSIPGYPQIYWDTGIFPFAASHVNFNNGKAGLNASDLSRLNFVCVRNLNGVLDTPAVHDLKATRKIENGKTVYSATYNFSGVDNQSFYAWVSDENYIARPIQLSDEEIQTTNDIDELQNHPLSEYFQQLLGYVVTGSETFEFILRKVGPNGEIEPYVAKNLSDKPHTLFLFAYDGAKAQQGRGWGNFIVAETGETIETAEFGAMIGANQSSRIYNSQTNWPDDALEYIPWFEEAFLQFFGRSKTVYMSDYNVVPLEDIVVTVSWDEEYISRMSTEQINRINQLMGSNVTSPAQWELNRFIDVTLSEGNPHKGVLNDPERKLRFRQPPPIIPIKVSVSSSANYNIPKPLEISFLPSVWMTGEGDMKANKVEALDTCERKEDIFFRAGNPEPNPIIRDPSVDLANLSEKQNVYSEYYRFGDEGRLFTLPPSMRPELDPYVQSFYPWKNAAYLQPNFFLVNNSSMAKAWYSMALYGGNWLEASNRWGGFPANLRYWTVENTYGGVETPWVRGSYEATYTTEGRATGWTAFNALVMCNAHMDSDFRKPYLTVAELKANNL